MSLLYRIQHPRDALVVEGSMPITSLYTVGIAGERFFREIMEQARLFATRCPECDVTYLPPRLYCERCFSQLDEWVEAPATGRVHTYTTVHIDLDGNPLPEPRTIAFVRIDDTDGGIVHYLGKVDPSEVYIGMGVEAVFKKKSERKGSITDIAYFRPV
ncbi:MAG: Zn-ribbon domain-containing OB-fold protein [Anaerolineae bacterium]|nr:Zn-ribbon domain-containing OB-fold protein [Anaerolineae bacterium]